MQETRFREAIAITRKFLDHPISKKLAQIRFVETVRLAELALADQA